MSDILKQKILRLEIDTFVNNPVYGLKPRTGKEVARLASKHFYVDDDTGDVVSKHEGAEVSLPDWIRYNLPTEEDGTGFLFTEHFKEKKARYDELKTYNSERLKKWSQTRLWEEATRLEEEKRLKQGRR